MTKKYLALTLAAMFGVITVSSIVGCSKDGHEIIIGEWEVTATSYTYFGSPNPSANYSGYLTMDDCAGCGHIEYMFYRDNTGMRTSDYIGLDGDLGSDTMRFTYTINNKEGIIVPISDGQETTWTTTRTIQIVDSKRITIFEKTIAEDYHDYVGDTSSYTRLIETYNYCKKK